MDDDRGRRTHPRRRRPCAGPGRAHRAPRGDRRRAGARRRGAGGRSGRRSEALRAPARSPPRRAPRAPARGAHGRGAPGVLPVAHRRGHGHHPRRRQGSQRLAHHDPRRGRARGLHPRHREAVHHRLARLPAHLLRLQRRPDAHPRDDHRRPVRRLQHRQRVRPADLQPQPRLVAVHAGLRLGRVGGRGRRRRVVAVRRRGRRVVPVLGGPLARVRDRGDQPAGGAAYVGVSLRFTF
jgi:hypothetical protein